MSAADKSTSTSCRLRGRRPRHARRRLDSHSAETPVRRSVFFRRRLANPKQTAWGAAVGSRKKPHTPPPRVIMEFMDIFVGGALDGSQWRHLGRGLLLAVECAAARRRHGHDPIRASFERRGRCAPAESAGHAGVRERRRPTGDDRAGGSSSSRTARSTREHQVRESGPVELSPKKDVMPCPARQGPTRARTFRDGHLTDPNGCRRQRGHAQKFGQAHQSLRTNARSPAPVSESARSLRE